MTSHDPMKPEAPVTQTVKDSESIVPASQKLQNETFPLRMLLTNWESNGRHVGGCGVRTFYS